MLVVQYAFGISQDSLITETARLFDINHTGENVKESIEKILENLLNTKKLHQANGTISIPETYQPLTTGRITDPEILGRGGDRHARGSRLKEYSSEQKILPYETHIRGINYENRKQAALKARVNQRVKLIRDCQNRFDRNAIKVFLQDQELGFIPRELAQLLAPDMDCGLSLKGTITEYLLETSLR